MQPVNSLTINLFYQMSGSILAQSVIDVLESLQNTHPFPLAYFLIHFSFYDSLPVGPCSNPK